MTTTPPAAPRLPCKHCNETADDHVKGKCLFGAQTYAPIEALQMRRWFIVRAGTHRYGDNGGYVKTLYFDQGYCFAFRSEAPIEAAGVWVNCGRYRSTAERRQLEKTCDRYGGFEEIVATRGPDPGPPKFM